MLCALHPDTLTSAYNLARDLSALEKHEEADRLCEDILTCCQRALSKNHPEPLIRQLVKSIKFTGRHLARINRRTT